MYRREFLKGGVGLLAGLYATRLQARAINPRVISSA